MTRLLVSVVLLAAGTAGSWWAWLGWDHTYQVDPVTGVTSGPYEAWQVVGCVLTLLVLAVLAALVRWWLPLAVMPIAFAVTWSAQAASEDVTGLWAVGAFMLAVGLAVGTLVVGGSVLVVRSLWDAWRSRGPAGGPVAG